jgi:hypothetical protein
MRFLLAVGRKCGHTHANSGQSQNQKYAYQPFIRPCQHQRPPPCHKVSYYSIAKYVSLQINQIKSAWPSSQALQIMDNPRLLRKSQMHVLNSKYHERTLLV